MHLEREKREAIARHVWRIVNALPQREAIRESDAAAWVDAVVAKYHEEAIWHATRLGGFGGSEIGVLVRNYQGQRADFGLSAREIVEIKLMRRLPDDDSSHLRRGRENERFHAQKFYEKWTAQRDEHAYNVLKNAKGRRPWMRYSPDDVVRMPFRLVESGGQIQLVRSSENGLWLIDYKAPSVVEPTNKVLFQYAAQLHQGAILCAEQGIELEGMLLSQFDWANWSLKDDVVVWDPDLGKLLLEAGDHYWGFVERGELPPYVVRQAWEPDPSYVEQMRDAARRYAALAALAAAAEERAVSIRQQILQPLSGFRLGNARLEFKDVDGSRLLTISVNRIVDKEQVSRLFTPEQQAACEKAGTSEYDVDAMVSFLKDQGVDVERFKRRKFDADKVVDMALKLGLDPDNLMKEQMIFRVAPHIKDAMREFIAEHYPETDAGSSDEVSEVNRTDEFVR